MTSKEAPDCIWRIADTLRGREFTGLGSLVSECKDQGIAMNRQRSGVHGLALPCLAASGFNLTTSFPKRGRIHRQAHQALLPHLDSRPVGRHGFQSH